MIGVRQATMEDVPCMMEIARHTDTAAQWSQSQYQQLFSSDRITLVIEEENQVAGFIAGRGTAGEWEIENIVVSKPTRRSGLGSRLLGEFLHHIRCSGGSFVFLEVRESNQVARAFYEKWAFVEAGRRKHYYRNPEEDALVLSLSFPQES
jgi:ribosomal-protein-alanine N-acetyltransferase